MVEGLPLVGVPVPVEPGGLDVHVEVVAQPLNDPGESWAALKEPIIRVKVKGLQALFERFHGTGQNTDCPSFMS